MRFTVCDALANGNIVAGPLTNSATGVTNGLFAVTLDFGSGVFTGSNRWLEMAARTNGAAAFTTLAPRQPILPTPYAIMANSASNLLGTLPAGQLGAGRWRTIPLPSRRHRPEPRGTVGLGDLTTQTTTRHPVQRWNTDITVNELPVVTWITGHKRTR